MTVTVTAGITFSGGGFTFQPLVPPGQKAIFGFGQIEGPTRSVSMTNLVSDTGVVATDTPGVGTVRIGSAASTYGSTGQAIFGYGYNSTAPGTLLSVTNLVSSAGVVSTDTPGVGTARFNISATGYGTDKGMFGFGVNAVNTYFSVTNLVSNTGVVASDTPGVGTARAYLAASKFGSSGQALFGFGFYGTSPQYLSMTNIVSNTGVVSSDTPGVGTARRFLAAATYGTDKALFGFGSNSFGQLATTNLVSNTGVVATDTTGVGTVRGALAAAGYGGDKAIFGYGSADAGNTSVTNLVSNTGVVASDTPGVGTARSYIAATSYN